MSARRVAVVVFCEVESETELDAESVAPLAVRRALVGGDQPARFPADLSTDAYGQRFSVRAVWAMEAGLAIGNGYLWTAVTGKAFREGGF